MDFLEAMVLAEVLEALAVMEAEDMAVHLPEDTEEGMAVHLPEDTEEGMDDDLWRFENYRRKCRRI